MVAKVEGNGFFSGVTQLIGYFKNSISDRVSNLFSQKVAPVVTHLGLIEHQVVVVDSGRQQELIDFVNYLKNTLNQKKYPEQTNKLAVLSTQLCSNESNSYLTEELARILNEIQPDDLGLLVVRLGDSKVLNSVKVNEIFNQVIIELIRKGNFLSVSILSEHKSFISRDLWDDIFKETGISMAHIGEKDASKYAEEIANESLKEETLSSIAEIQAIYERKFVTGNVYAFRNATLRDVYIELSKLNEEDLDYIEDIFRDFILKAFDRIFTSSINRHHRILETSEAIEYLQKIETYDLTKIGQTLNKVDQCHNEILKNAIYDAAVTVLIKLDEFKKAFEETLKISDQLDRDHAIDKIVLALACVGEFKAAGYFASKMTNVYLKKEALSLIKTFEKMYQEQSNLVGVEITQRILKKSLLKFFKR